MGIPWFMVSFGIESVKQNMESEKYNPFQIEIGSLIKNVKNDGLFVYSENDTVIGRENS